MIITLAGSGLLSLAGEEVELLWLMTAVSIVYFTLFCLIAFFLGVKAVKSRDLNAMNKLFMALVLVKLTTALVLVVVFLKIFEPSGKLFILPFIIAYVAYTAVEVISLRTLLRSH
ncbi:MAG: hypothetical protein EA409_12825 [Saprospirales bacterium]|nr:MAG: hypothetical protein EA409_12825 [Saprospirales bacterium]